MIKGMLLTTVYSHSINVSQLMEYKWLSLWPDGLIIPTTANALSR